MTIENTWKAILAVVFFVMWATLSNDDYQQEKISQDLHCKMIVIWNANKHLPPESRPGWPPESFDGECPAKSEASK